MSDIRRVAVLNGVNLDRLGRRAPELYGTGSLEDLESDCVRWGLALDLQIEPFQTNHEGEFVERVHEMTDVGVFGVIANLAAWTHYSRAIGDALADLASGERPVPVVEVHISDVDAREPWRRSSVLEDVRAHRVSGQGRDGYRVALEWLAGRDDPAG